MNQKDIIKPSQKKRSRLVLKLHPRAEKLRTARKGHRTEVVKGMKIARRSI